MTELIKISTDQNGNQTISAKDLYEFLGLDPINYARWAKKYITGNELAREGEDWVFFQKEENPLGGRPTKDFALTLDFAKRLAMMARSVEGERIRNYFLECERKAKQETSLLEIEKLKLVVATFDARLKLLEKPGAEPKKKETKQPQSSNVERAMILVEKHLTSGGPHGQFMTTAEVADYLRRLDGPVGSISCIGRALRALGHFKYQKRFSENRRWGYWLTTIS